MDQNSTISISDSVVAAAVVVAVVAAVVAAVVDSDLFPQWACRSIKTHMGGRETLNEV